MIYTGTANVPLGYWGKVMARGFLFDLATLAYILPVFLLADVFLLERLRTRHWFSRAATVFLTLPVFLLLFLIVAEITFWMEFHTRFNFIALDYLIYTNEVIRNIWQSYPMVWILSALALLSGLTAWFLNAHVWQRLPRLSRGAKGGMVVAAVVLPLISARLAYVEGMYHQGNTFAEELSGNGLFTLAAAARHNELDYDQFYATIPQEKADAILRGLDVEWTDDVYRRTHDRWGDDAGAHPLPPFLKRRPKHVVLISVESLSAKFVGAYGSTEGLTPRLDALAKAGYLFRHVYATGTRTVRGLEALSLSTPPIPGQSIIRRPKNAHLASIGQMLRLQSYAVSFFYGGYGYFDNMNAFFHANGYDVRDRSSIPDKTIIFENAWGVSDEDLYNHALRTLDESATPNKPMFVHIMTTSNHRPYTYPQGRIDIPSPGGRRGAVKYTDFAIGQFIDEAKKKPWFKDTLVAIVADHCASVAGRTELPVADYRIPLIFYGPAIVRPGQFDRMISQIDIPPTLMDVLGTAGDDNLFGKETVEQTGPPRAFISNYQNLGYYKKDQLIVLKPKRRVEAYRVDPMTLESTPITPDRILVDEAIAYYQTASRAFKRGKLELLWK